MQARSYVSRNWALQSFDKSNTIVDRDNGIGDWDRILEDIYKNSFSISAMGFQDVWNIDLKRVKECCIHVVTQDGKLIPLCLYNITDRDGNYLYRQ